MNITKLFFIQKFQFSKKLATSVLVFFVFILPFYSFAQTNLEQNVETNYIVKLKDKSYLAELRNLSIDASSIEQQFEFSSEVQFQNIFTFKSTFSLEDLRRNLGLKAD